MKQRKESVVWTTDVWETDYEGKGYKTSPFFYDEEVVRMARAESLALEKEATNLPSAVYEKDGKTLRSLFDIHNLSKHLVNLLVTPALIKLAEDILGSKVYIHQFHINYKRRFRGGDFFWHSDYTFWHWEDGMMEPRCLSFMVLLDYVYNDNGPLMAAPGSHLHYGHSEWFRDNQEPNEAVKHEVVGEPEKNGLATPDQLEMIQSSGVYTFTGGPGDLMIMDANLLHASGPNLSPWDRPAAFICLNSVHNKLQDPPSGRPHRPTYISSQDYTPL